MKRLFLMISSFFLFNICFAQQSSILRQFEKIPLGHQRYEITGYMANEPDFGSEVKVNPINFPQNYSYNEYSNDSFRLILSFYKGILYEKKLVQKYPITKMNEANAEASSIRASIKNFNKVFSYSSGDISVIAYGGPIGKEYTYSLSPNFRDHKTKSVAMLATLDITYNYELKKSSATIIGYEVDYKVTDITNTDLDITKGITTFQ